MEMVEKVAEAIHEERIRYAPTAEGGYEFESEPWHREAVAYARAAIEAIEEDAVIVAPYSKVTWHGEGADEEFELVPTSRQRVYEQTINELKYRLSRLQSRSGQERS